MNALRLILITSLCLVGCVEPPVVNQTAAPSQPASRPAPAAGAHFCDAYGPNITYADAVAIFEHAGMQYGTKDKEPYGSLPFALWKKETGSLYGGGGKCLALEQLKIRCKHVPSSCGNIPALKRIADRFHWDVNRIAGSCGTSTMEVNTKDHGGCIGPVQVDPMEWVKHPVFGTKNPENLCWAIHFVMDVVRHKRDIQVRHGKGNWAAWERSSRAYYGSAGSPRSEPYYTGLAKLYHEYPTWRERILRKAHRSFLASNP